MKKMLKVVFFIIVTVFMVSCGDKNEIPNELLGTYIQDGEEPVYTFSGKVIPDYYKRQGIAKLYRKGNRYYLEVDSKYIIEGKIVSTYELKANGKIKKIQYEEFPSGVLKPFGEYVKDIYTVSFTDLKASGKDGHELKYDPKITLIGERKLLTKEEDIIEYRSYSKSFKYESNPISMLWINGKEFKKIQEKK